LVDKIPHDAPVLVIGLGRFGAATAGELDKLGRDVLAVDEDPALVQKWSDRVKHTAVLHARNMNALEQIGARDFPIAVVATGSSIAKAISESHGKILTRIGAHRVIYPEREAGERVAHLVSGRMIDFIRFDDNFALVKMYPPKFTYATEKTVVTNHDLIIVSGTNEDIETFAALDK